MSAAVVDLARRLAERIHASDVDQLKVPYLGHLEHVASAVRAAVPDDDELIAAAYLHDSVEDHPDEVSFESLRADGIPDGVLGVVDDVSRRNGEVYADFITRAMERPRSALLKRADMGHNFLPARSDALAAVDPDKAASLASRYAPQLARLDAALVAAGLNDELDRLRAFEASA